MLGAAPLPGDRGDVDDLPALALRIDVTNDRLRAEERSADLDIHNALEEVGIEIRHGRSVFAPRDGGVVDEDVDAAELAHNSLDGRLGLLPVGDVEAQRQPAAAFGTNLLNDAVDVFPANGLLVIRKRRRIAPGSAHRDIGAKARKRYGGGPTDAAKPAGAGNQRNSAFKFLRRRRVCHGISKPVPESPILSR